MTLFTFSPQLNYREAYHKEKHLYTTVLDTYDYARCFNLKQLYSTVSLKNQMSSMYLAQFMLLGCVAVCIVSSPTESILRSLGQDQGQELQHPS